MSRPKKPFLDVPHPIPNMVYVVTDELSIRFTDDGTVYLTARHQKPVKVSFNAATQLSDLLVSSYQQHRHKHSAELKPK